MTNPLNLPKAEDVKSYDLGETSVHLVQITKDNAKYLAELSALLMIEGRACRYCLIPFTPDDVHDVVWATKPDDESSRFAHSECWDRHK